MIFCEKLKILCKFGENALCFSEKNATIIN